MLIFQLSIELEPVKALEETENQSLVFDFEDGTLQGWEVIEGYFEQLVSSRDFYHNFPTTAYNKQGKYYLSTVEQFPGKSSNDLMMGTVESPVIVLTSPEISFQMGAGYQENAYFAIFTADDKEYKRYRASNIEEMIRIEDSLPELVGQPIYMRLVDHDQSGWGHVTFDDFHATGYIDAEATFFRHIKNVITNRLNQMNNELTELEILFNDYETELTSSLKGLRSELDQWSERLRTIQTHFEKEFIEAFENEFERFCLVFENDFKAGHSAFVRSLSEILTDPILYVVRKPYQSHYHAIDTLFNSDEWNCERQMPHKNLFSPGGSLKIWDSTTDRSVTLIEAPEGVVRDPDVGFDADRIVLAIRNDRDTDYHIWEIKLHGIESFSELLSDPVFSSTSREDYCVVPDTNIHYHPCLQLQQLTTAADVADFDPIYMPDETIVFASTREPKYNMCSRDIASDLYRMNGDGSNIYQITKSTLFEHNPVLMPDGRICYHRWEYVDRNFGDAHAIWAVTPNGLNQTIYWGNNTAVPGGLYNPNIIEETGEMICIFGPHHALENGALALVDRRLGIDGSQSVIQLWPESFRQYVRDTGDFDCDTTVYRVPLKYEDPYVIDENNFLVSRMIVPDGKVGLYLLDRDNHEVFLREDETNDGIYDSMLIRARKRPALLEGNRDFEQNDGSCYVANVYEGTHMKSVPLGTAKYLRVVQSPEKKNFSCGSWNGQGYTAPGMNWHSLENKRILGTVPIEKDGSVAFKVPCDTFLFFQLLDENGRMIQTMRSGTVLQSGEKVSCIGCHEDRLQTYMNAQDVPIAMQKEPQELQTWYGEPREFGFMNEVQPVLDRYCVECHDYGKPAGDKLNLAGDRDLVFNTAYVNLWNSPYIKCIGAGPAELQENRAWGSLNSPLIEELDHPKIQEHIDAQLKERMTKEDLDRLCSWLDLNGVYYPCYESAWPGSLTGRTPYNDDELNRLGALLQINYRERNGYWLYPNPEVCFERPEWSPGLKRLLNKILAENPGMTEEEAKQTELYQEAIALIQLGADHLKERPRADMPGFVPCEKDQERLRKYHFRRAEELRFRKAIQNGTKTWDDPLKKEIPISE